MLSRVIGGWRQSAHDRKEKRLMTQLGDSKFSRKVLKKYYQILKEHAKEQKFIKNDRFLRRALVDGEDFFEVSVLQTSKGISDVMVQKLSSAKSSEQSDGSQQRPAKYRSYVTTVTNTRALNVDLVDI